MESAEDAKAARDQIVSQCHSQEQEIREMNAKLTEARREARDAAAKELETRRDALQTGVRTLSLSLLHNTHTLCYSIASLLLRSSESDCE